MGAIFINYRRSDGSGHAGRLYDRLVKDFGREKVFMDVSGIEPGRSFTAAIDQSIAVAGVMLVVIGIGWIEAVDLAGARRLDKPDDYVRLEIAAALHAHLPIIPVLVENAGMPQAQSLPEEIRELHSKQAWAFRNSSYDFDYAAVRELVRKHLAEGMLKDISLDEYFVFIKEIRKRLESAPLQEQRISDFLSNLDPIARIESYLELQLRPRKDRLSELLAALHLEHHLAVRTKETRPLWQNIETLHRHAEAFSPLADEARDNVKFALNQSTEFLCRDRDLDSGDHVKKSITSLISKL